MAAAVGAAQVRSSPSKMEGESFESSYASFLKKYNVASLPEGRPLKRLLLDGSLRQASLCMSGLNDKGVEALAAYLKTGPSLERLDLSSNWAVSQRGWRCLAISLSKNTKLKELYLHRNNISDSSCGHFAKALETNRTLLKLHMYHNNIGDAGCIALAGALTKNQGLAELNLFRNRIGERGGVEMAKALTSNRSLKELVLWGNKIGYATELALVTALKLNTTIEVITCELCLMADSKDLGYKKYNGDKPA